MIDDKLHRTKHLLIVCCDLEYFLFNGTQEVQELKAEIQRLKDENGALIRVVGKLSRAPMLQ